MDKTKPRNSNRGKPKDLPDNIRCTAHSKTTGERCKKPRFGNTDKCEIHGGKSLRGPAHPAYKGAGHSRVLPARMMEHYNAALDDPDILDMSADIATLDARIQDVLKRVDTGEAGHLWKQAREAYKAFQAATRAGDAQAIAIAMTQLDNTLGRGHSDYVAWREVLDLEERKSRLIDRQRRLLMDKKAVITVEEAMNLMGALLSAIREHVTDKQALSAISTEFSRIVNFPGRVSA